MTLHEELLPHAVRLATLEKPSQADFRRAVSASYYALFHLLIAEASQIVAPVSPSSLAARVGRGFQHSTMQDVCRIFAAGPLREPISSLVVLPIEPNLKLVARAFTELQDQRMVADYDTTFVADELWARNSVRSAIKATQAWRSLRRSANANVFSIALAFHKSWGRGA